jgi:hypothetical protein
MAYGQTGAPAASGFHCGPTGRPACLLRDQVAAWSNIFLGLIVSSSLLCLDVDPPWKNCLCVRRDVVAPGGHPFGVDSGLHALIPCHALMSKNSQVSQFVMVYLCLGACWCF